MGERNTYTPGTFSWVELATPDQEAAKRFYGGLFGWQLSDSPIGESAVYTMASVGDRLVAALAPQPTQQREAGVPALWHSYVTVESADAALEHAKQLGGRVHAGPFDVFTAGRMGVLQDPQGAFVMVWEPREQIGAGLVNAAGALCWNELASPDPEASGEFYDRLLGWSTERIEMGEGSTYLTVKNRDGHLNGGIRRAASTEPSYWLAYFGTDDIEASLARVHELGGTQLIDAPMEIPMGTLCPVQDPQGAVFALYQGEFDD